MKKKSKIVALVIVAVIILGAVILSFLSERKKNVAETIIEDIALLEQTLQKIDRDCEIIQFTNIKNPLTFLNVTGFAGSEVGTLNVAHPEHFNGPYLQDNPSLYGIEYQAIKTAKGLYIVPGDGVTLPNGKVIGKDIVFDENSDIEDLLGNDNALRYNNKSLGKKVEFVSEREQVFANVFEEYIED